MNIMHFVTIFATIREDGQQGYARRGEVVRVIFISTGAATFGQHFFFKPAFKIFTNQTFVPLFSV